MQLTPIQQQIVNDDRLKTIIGLGTGKGKTLSSLCLAKGKIFIVLEKQQKVDKTFENCIEKFNLDKDITIFTTDEFRKKHKLLPRCDTLIIDEAHKMLNGSVNYFRFKTVNKPSGICQALLYYVNFHDIERVYPLSATIDASPMTVYYASRITGVTYDIQEWVKAFYFLLNERYRPKKDDSINLRLVNVIKKNGYYEKHEEAPTQIYRQIYVDNTPEQQKRIEEIKMEYQDMQQVGKIYQIEQGVLKGNQFTESETFPCDKYQIVKDIIKDTPMVIIFATYTEQVDRVYEYLKDDFKVYKLTGKTKKKDRENMIHDLQSQDSYVLIVNTAIVSGWELPQCPLMIFFSLPYTTRSSKRIQAEGRIQRMNNLKVNTYIDIIAKGGVNEALYHAQKNNKKFNEMLYYNQNK